MFEPTADNIDRSLFTNILFNMMEGVVAVDKAGRVLFINQALASLFSIDSSQAKGKHLLEVVRQNQLNVLLQSVLQDQKNKIDEIRIFTPDEHVFEAIAVPLIENNVSVGAMLVLHDITRVRQLESIRRDFVANVSHEMRTPLASIKGFAETLRMGAMEDPAVASDFLKNIEKHTDNMAALVEDLLDLTAIESGQRAPNREPIAISEVIPEVIKGLAPIINRKKLTITNEITGNSPLVLVDKGHFKQILTNLLENAVKFNQEAGWVRLSDEQAGSFVLIHVTDSGSGIPRSKSVV